MYKKGKKKRGKGEVKIKGNLVLYLCFRFWKPPFFFSILITKKTESTCRGVSSNKGDKIPFTFSFFLLCLLTPPVCFYITIVKVKSKKEENPKLTFTFILHKKQNECVTEKEGKIQRRNDELRLLQQKSDTFSKNLSTISRNLKIHKKEQVKRQQQHQQQYKRNHIT